MTRLLPLPALALALIASGCRDHSVASYQIPKETDTPPAAASAPAMSPKSVEAPTAAAMPPAAGSSQAELTWTAPASWKSKPASAMRKASYTIEGEAGVTADLAISAFPGDVGGDLANVNRWRGQLQLPPLSGGELAANVTLNEFNGLHLMLVDFVGGDSAKPQRMLGAIIPLKGSTWFVKLSGPDALVAREKPAYLAFLRTLQTTP